MVGCRGPGWHLLTASPDFCPTHILLFEYLPYAGNFPCVILVNANPEGKCLKLTSTPLDVPVVFIACLRKAGAVLSIHAALEAPEGGGQGPLCWTMLREWWSALGPAAWTYPLVSQSGAYSSTPCASVSLSAGWDRKSVYPLYMWNRSGAFLCKVLSTAFS